MTTNIVFDHRARTKVGQEGPVEIRLTNNRQSVYINTGVHVKKSEFRGGEVINREDAAELNGLIKALGRRAIDAAAQIIENGSKINGAEIKRIIFANGLDENKGSKNDMIIWMESQIQKLDIKDGTRAHYYTMLTRLKEYSKLTMWSQLSTENIVEFDAWLHNIDKPLSLAQKKVGKIADKIGRSTVYNYHKCFKCLLNRALLFGKIDRNPYDKLKGRFGRGDKDTADFLTEAEMDAIKSLHPVNGSEMANARDLFVFQLETGLSYADTQVFDFDEYRQINGRWINIGHRVKTNVQYIAELSDECLDILKRHNMTLPKLCNQDYNKCLKLLGQAAGVGKPLHSHLARHSFATLMIAKGAKIENVSRMLGHTNITQTQRYAKVLPKSVLEDFRKVRGK